MRRQRYCLHHHPPPPLRMVLHLRKSRVAGRRRRQPRARPPWPWHHCRHRLRRLKRLRPWSSRNLAAQGSRAHRASERLTRERTHRWTRHCPTRRLSSRAAVTHGRLDARQRRLRRSNCPSDQMRRPRGASQPRRNASYAMTAVIAPPRRMTAPTRQTTAPTRQVIARLRRVIAAQNAVLSAPPIGMWNAIQNAPASADPSGTPSVAPEIATNVAGDSSGDVGAVATRVVMA